MSELDVQTFLSHFGVKGMKWGVVNQDNGSGKTSSGDSKQQRRDRKAQVHLNNVKDIQKELDKLQTVKIHNGFEAQSYISRKALLERQKQQELDAAKAKQEGHLTAKEKKIVIGVGVAAALLAAYGANNALQSGSAHSAIAKGEAFMTGKKATDFRKNLTLADKSLDADGIFHTVVQDINPNPRAIGAGMNCRRCTFAYEMRRRGMDVAATRTTNARGQNITGVFNALHPESKDVVGSGRASIAYKVLKENLQKGIRGPRPTPFTDELNTALKTRNSMGKIKINDLSSYGIFDSIRQHPDGARGELGMIWSGGGGHSMAWEVVHGKPVIFDTQVHKVYKTPDEFFEISSNMASAALTRLDNVNLNSNFLLRWVKNA